MNSEKRRTILLVEDEAIIAITEKSTLEKYGYRVETAYSGEQAVAAVAVTPGIDLILMDIDLGAGMDGTEAAALILKDRDLPVVFLSSHTDPEVVAKTEKITSYGYVVKDSSGTVLDASIKMAFKLFAAKIKEREKEAALRESEERMRAIIEGTPHLFFYTQDVEANTTYVSPTIEQITGYKTEAWLKRWDWFITDATINQEAKSRTHAHLQGEYPDGPILMEITHAKGYPILLEAYEYPVSKNGRIAGLQGVAHDITQRKRAEEEKETALQALRESEDRYRDLVENSHDLICTHNLEGKFLSVNETAARLTGYPLKDLLGMNMIDLLEPEVRHGFAAYLLRVKTRGHARGRMRIRTAGGETRYWEYDNTLRTNDVAFPIVRGIAHDITERIRAEFQKEAAYKAMCASEDRYRDLVENSQDLICTHNLEGRILSINSAAARLTGYSQQELLGMNMADLLLPEVRHLFKSYLAEILAKGWSRGTMRVQTASGEPRYWEYYNSLRTKDVAVPIVRALGHDITERERTEKIQNIEYAIASAMVQTKTLSELLETVQKELMVLIDTTNFMIAMYDESSGMFSTPFERDEKDAMPQWRAEKSLTGLVISRKRPLLLSKDQIRQLNQAGTIELIGSRSETWLGVPLLTNKKTLGAIVVQSYNKANAYDQRGVTLLEIIANQLSAYIERKEAEEEIKRQLTEKEILLREAHHRIKNNFASIGGLLTMHMRSIANPQAIAALQDAIGRVDSMQILYDKLLLSADFNDVSVKNYVESLAASVVSLFPDLAKVKLNLNVDDFKLDSKRLFPLGIIINELLTNIMKYAFAGKKSGTITLTLAKDGSRVTLTLQDNGAGLPSGFDIRASKGFGLTLVKMLSQQLGGSFSIKKHAGTRCTVAFNI